MKISELKTGQGKVDIEAKVIETAEPREFNKYGRLLRVANATIRDDSGTIKLSLWNADIDRVKKGDTVKITNGYVSEFQGEKQLTTGKFGQLEVIEGKGGAEESENNEQGETMKKGKKLEEEEKVVEDEEKVEDKVTNEEDAFDEEESGDEDVEEEW